MNPQEMQQSNPQLSPEESKATLGLSTRLMDEFLMSQAQQMMPAEAPVEPQEAQGEDLDLEEEKDPEMEKEGLKKEIMKEVKSAIKEEIGDIKNMLKDALEDEDDEEEKGDEEE